MGEKCRKVISEEVRWKWMWKKSATFSPQIWYMEYYYCYFSNLKVWETVNKNFIIAYECFVVN